MHSSVFVILSTELKRTQKFRKPNYNLRTGKVLRKHSLHEENSSLGFIEAVYKQLSKMPLHRSPLAHEWNPIFKPKHHSISDHSGQKKYNYTMMKQKYIQMQTGTFNIILL